MSMMFHARADHNCAYGCCSSLKAKGRRKRRDNFHSMFRARENRAWRAELSS
jgi:hypothetical protein